jgi:alpha/beta superfamily hydrolase
VRAWAAGYEPPPEVLVVAAAEHFFHGKLTELRQGVLRFLQENGVRPRLSKT